MYQSNIYIIRSGGILNCRDAETGKTIYDKRIDAPGGYFASPVVAGDHIYLANDRGEIIVTKGGDTFEKVSHSELGESVAATPAIINNSIFIRSAENLWAFGH